MGLKHLIQETLSNYGIIEDGGGCGCGKAEDKMALLESKAPISEGLRYHIENGISLQENVYRVGSKKYLQLFAEARMLNEWGTIQLDKNSQHLVENTDIGKFGVLDGKRVPLDIPMINENPAAVAAVELERIISALNDIADNTEELEPRLRDLDVDLDYIASILTQKSPLSIGLDQKILGKLARPKTKTNESETVDAALVNTIKDEPLTEKKKKKKKKDPPIGKPMRSSSGGSAYKVYVRDPKSGNVKTVRFGSGGLRAKIRNPKARNAFAKRHKCSQKKDRTKASYWSCNLPRYAPALGLGAKMNTYW